MISGGPLDYTKTALPRYIYSDKMHKKSEREQCQHYLIKQLFYFYLSFKANVTCVV